jgi:general L-amino acid transport system permease protein
MVRVSSSDILVLPDSREFWCSRAPSRKQHPLAARKSRTRAACAEVPGLLAKTWPFSANGDRVAKSAVNDPRVRGFVYQALLVVALVLLIGSAWRNALVNMEARGIPLGFGFWNETAGFDINMSLIDYSALSTYGRAFWVGLLNTLLVSAISIALVTPLGFAIGIARLSPNWMLSRLALVYVELTRNTPLLLQLLFWYNAVLKALPAPKQSIDLHGFVLLNTRGLFLPKPLLGDGAWAIGAAFAIGAMGAALHARQARKRQQLTGERPRVAGIVAIAMIAPPVLVYFLLGRPLDFSFAKLQGFNLRGGLQVYPEFAALTFGLVTYTAGFIAEIVRAGVLAVSAGQSEAASALGLSRGQRMKLVVVPQAMRLVIPPLTSQYLNIVKNSSLAVLIGYPDLVLIFSGTVLNQTHAAIQVMAVTMGVYLAISLVISYALNLFNARNALKER